MNKRIRYINGENGYVSMRVLLAEDGKEYLAKLNSDQLTGCILCISTNETFPSKGTSPHKTKIANKKLLESKGVVFEKETRATSESS